MNHFSTRVERSSVSRRWRWLLMLVLLLGLGLGSGRTWASCTSASDIYVPMQVISQNPNAPVGGVVATLQVTTPATNVGNCTSAIPASIYIYNNPVTISGPVPGYSGVNYMTNSSTLQRVASLGTRIVSPTTAPPVSLGPGTIIFPSTTWTAQVIRLTKDVPGTMTNLCMGNYWRAGGSGSTGALLPLVVGAGSGGVNVGCGLTISVGSTGTCNVTTTNVAIGLGSVNPSAMPSVGSTSPTSAPQNVALTCSGNPAVSMSMSGTSAGLTPNNVLALTGASQAGGVRVQLIYNGNPLVFNQAYSVSNSAPNALSVPIAAQYYRTGALTPGTANANATLNFTYN